MEKDKALEKAVEYILDSSEDYCQDLCPYLKECCRICAEQERLYGDSKIDRNNCKRQLIKRFKGV